MLFDVVHQSENQFTGLNISFNITTCHIILHYRLQPHYPVLSVDGCFMDLYSSSYTNILSNSGGEVWQVWVWSHSDVLGAGPAEAEPRQDSQHGGHRPGEILQVGKDSIYQNLRSCGAGWLLNSRILYFRAARSS